MSRPPGHETGHPPPAGYTWGDDLAAPVDAHGSRSSVARARAIATRLEDEELLAGVNRR